MASHTITETVAVEPTYHMKMAPQPPPQARGTNTLRLRHLKLDPSRALEPARKKLTTIESQRIMAVFEESIKRAEIVTALPYILENIDRFKVSLGTELVDAIKQHSRIQFTYRDIRAQLDELLQRRERQLAQAASRASSLKPGEAGDEEGEGLEDQFGEDGGEVGDGEEEDRFEKEQEDDGQNEAESISKSEASSGQKASSPVNEQGSTEILQGSSKENVSDNIEQMMGDRPKSSYSDIDPRIEEVMRNLGLVAQQVSHSCKNILRLFALNPAATKIVTSEAHIRDEGGQNIVNSMYELRDILMHKLLTTPQEETERMAYLEEISKRERHNAAIIGRQEQDLKEALDDKEEEIRKKNEIIKRLQTDLHQIEKFSDENIRRTRAEAEKQEIADSKNSDQKTQKLQAEINQLQTQLNNAVTEHREKEAELRAKKYKVENEVDNWIQKYDQDMGERQDEYEEIDLVYTEEKKQLFELEERFATLEKEYTAIMEERRVARDKRERAQRELALLVKSATTIQAFWRSYKVRKALKSKNKKKGGKGKKK
ncbi:dynein regulatory complex protein 10 [Aplysia californica]|uniref:Dynein regulatory complex protein 10 n=1 Tax=Aplysia californica TaxID=6500 RepID=A0ABM0ZUF1_APLCA|nr:dynein regulatory complex protein 10 [Aplysia californica]